MPSARFLRPSLLPQPPVGASLVGALTPSPEAQLHSKGPLRSSCPSAYQQICGQSVYPSVSLRGSKRCYRSPLPFFAPLRVPSRINPPIPTPETRATARLPPPNPSRNAIKDFRKKPEHKKACQPNIRLARFNTSLCVCPPLFYRGSIGDKGMTHRISLSGGGGHSR